MLLSRTADHLYWHARYIERAENTARMLAVNFETLLMPHQADSEINLWRATLGLSELEPSFLALYDEINTANVLAFMITDTRNPSSIVSSLWAARENARAVRGSLTSEMYETINSIWIESREWVSSQRALSHAPEYLEWVKMQSHLILGVALGTMLKDETFNFLRMGTFIERADNTARLLDLKFFERNEVRHIQEADKETESDSPALAASHAALSSLTTANDSKDFYHWAALLRSVSGFEVYRQTYHDVITPERVAELLIFRKEMPRSLAACVNDLRKNIQYVRNDYSANTERLVGRMHADLQYGQIQEVLQGGIHAYLTEFLEKTFELGQHISQDFLVPLHPAHAKLA